LGRDSSRGTLIEQSGLGYLLAIEDREGPRKVKART
jgi:hypothetical protein